MEWKEFIQFIIIAAGVIISTHISDYLSIKKDEKKRNNND